MQNDGDHRSLHPVLVETGQWRQRDFRLARLAVAQDDQVRCWDALGQHVTAQHRSGKGLQPYVQGGEDSFSCVGHSSFHSRGLGRQLMLAQLTLPCEAFSEGGKGILTVLRHHEWLFSK